MDVLKIFRFYAKADLKIKFFLSVRWLLTPYQKMANQFPKEGRVLDQGCGHGLLALCLATSPKREVLGFDHDSKRVELAGHASRNFSNLTFMKGSFFGEEAVAFKDETFSGIALIDVMHYFTEAEQEHILKKAYKILAPGGKVIFREVNPDAGLISKWNRLYEKAATFSGFTQSLETNLTFRKPIEWESLLRDAGFDQVKSASCSSILFADVLYTGVKSTTK